MNRAHDLGAQLADLPRFDVARETTDHQAEAAMRPLDELNGAMLGLVRFTGLTPWECHPDGDELLHVLEGEVEVVVLAARGPESTRAALGPGSVYVVPKGLWHRQQARPEVALLFATPAAHTDTSWAEDPRRDA